MNNVLLLGVLVYFLSRAFVYRVQELQNNGYKLDIYGMTLVLLEICTIIVIIIQLCCWPIKWNMLDPWQTIGVIIFFFGISLSIWARIVLKNNWHTASKFAKLNKIITTGPYKCIRHPIYAGSLLMGYGFELALSSWLIFIVLIIGTPLVIVCTIKEEKLLINWFEDYKEYQKNTTRFIPFIF